MTGSQYEVGRRVEWAVVHDLTAAGYECTRAASSKGVADVIAIGVGLVLLVSCKRTTMPGPAERTELLRIARLIPVALALVALKPARKPLQYRMLTGDGPRDWIPWSL